MEYYDFLHQCQSRCISVGIVLENEEITKALTDGDDEKVIQLLDSVF